MVCNIFRQRSVNCRLSVILHVAESERCKKKTFRNGDEVFIAQYSYPNGIPFFFSFTCYETLQHKLNAASRMNRIRCTKLVLLIVFVSLFAYLMLKDESTCTNVDDAHRRITSRQIGSMLFEGESTFHLSLFRH